MSYVAELKQRVVQLEAENRLLQSKLQTFFTGDIPQGATIDHMILAKYGRIRILEKAKQPALLTK